MKKLLYFHVLLASPESQPSVSIFDTDMSKYGCGTVFLTREVEFDLPTKDDIIASAVAQLQALQTRALADYEVKRAEIAGQLDRFLALEMAPAETSS